MSGALVRFADIRGHDRIRSFLQSAVGEDRLAHALLFAGPDGVGKRSVALAFTAWLCCEQRPDGDACGVCNACRQLAVGAHPDVMQLAVAAGKKEIGVDRARELKRFTQMRPMHAPTKVAIINDAHLLSVAAQNALLKTLEEPAQRSLILLVTSTPDELLPTVRSRCQRIRFAPLPPALIRELLLAHGVDAATAESVAPLAEGSLARALMLRESAQGEQRQHIEQLLAGVGGARYCALMPLADALSRPEAQLAAKLELLLAHYTKQAAQHLDEGAQRSRALRAANAVQEAWGVLRESNPNRQLLIESLLLRLAAN